MGLCQSVQHEQNAPVDKLASLEYLLVMKPATEIHEENVEAYLAGYR